MKSSNKTKVFREAVGVFFILSIVLVIGYYFYLNKKYSKENTSISEQTKISMNGVNDIIPTPRMIPELNWNNDFISVKSDGIRYHFRLIIDGKAYYDPINIMTKDGEILAESKLYLNGYYKDKENKLRNVKLPIIIKMQNGKLAFCPAAAGLIQMHRKFKALSRGEKFLAPTFMYRKFNI